MLYVNHISNIEKKWLSYAMRLLGKTEVELEKVGSVIPFVSSLFWIITVTSFPQFRKDWAVLWLAPIFNLHIPSFKTCFRQIKQRCLGWLAWDFHSLNSFVYGYPTPPLLHSPDIVDFSSYKPYIVHVYFSLFVWKLTRWWECDENHIPSLNAYHLTEILTKRPNDANCKITCHF